VYFRFLGFWDNTLSVVVNRATDVSVLTASKLQSFIHCSNEYDDEQERINLSS